MRRPPSTRAQGVSLLSAVLVLFVFGFLVVMGGRLVPIYLEYQGVAHTLDTVAAGDSTSEASVRAVLERGFGVADVHTISARDVDITRTNGELTAVVDYDAVAPFLGNVGFVVHFHKMVTVNGAGR